MTLRITLEIVPFGNEANKRTIYQFDISNTGTSTKSGKTRYEAQQLIPTPEDGGWVGFGCKLLHRREDGAIKLAGKLLQHLGPSYGYLGT